MRKFENWQRENEQLVSCKRDCVYFDFKGDEPICKLSKSPMDYETRDIIANQHTNCPNYRLENV